MKRIRSFDYHEPTTITEATEILAKWSGDACPLAGGTDLLIDLKMLNARPKAIVNLKRIPGMDGIDIEDGGTRIGALVPVRVLELTPLIPERHRALAQAAAILASVQVRNLATVGGNIGRASPASDMAPPLIVHDAVLTVAGQAGIREIPIDEFYLGPGRTVLGADEIITSVFVPAEDSRTGSAHLKLGKRGGGTDIALAGAAASVDLGDGGEIVGCRIALASVGPTPLRATGTEGVLTGAAPTKALLDAAADAAAQEATPMSDMRASEGYRRSLIRVLSRRALEQAVVAAGGEVSV